MTPFPIAVLPPQYQISTHRVEMQVLHFFPTDPHTGTPVGMEIWLGNLGPLSAQTVMPPTAPPGSMPNAMFTPGPTVGGGASPYGATYAQGGSNPGPGVDAHFVRAPQSNGVAVPSTVADTAAPSGTDEAGNPPLPGTGRHTSLDPPGTRRTTDPVMIVSVEMPPMTTILQAIRDLSSPAVNGAAPIATDSATSTGGSNNTAAGPSTAPSPGNTPANQGSHFVLPPPQPGGANAPGAVRQGGMMGGRAVLPIIFVRPFDYVGYMTGYSIACENVFSGNGMGDPGLTGSQGWTLRVV